MGAGKKSGGAVIGNHGGGGWCGRILAPSLAVLAFSAGVLALPAQGMGQPIWRGLVVAPENRCSPYRPSDYRYPRSVELEVIRSMGGRVYGPYTGRVFAHRGQTDIEHIVARSEAHDSGLCRAGAATRLRFAADPLNLTLAGAAVNRCGRGGKCAHDAGGWLPRRNRCWFAGRVVEVRRKYGLTVDRREARALERVLSGCGRGTAMEMPR